MGLLLKLYFLMHDLKKKKIETGIGFLRSMLFFKCMQRGKFYEMNFPKRKLLLKELKTLYMHGE